MNNLLEMGIPRSHCFAWDEWTLLVYVGSAIVIAMSYVMIPLDLMYAYRRSIHKLPPRYMVFGFCAFIWLCGIGHLVDDVMTFYWPAYRVVAIWKMATAIVSAWVAIRLRTGIAKFLIAEGRLLATSIEQQCKKDDTST